MMAWSSSGSRSSNSLSQYTSSALCPHAFSVSGAEARIQPQRRKAAGCGGEDFMENCLHQYLSLLHMIIRSAAESATKNCRKWGFFLNRVSASSRSDFLFAQSRDLPCSARVERRGRAKQLQALSNRRKRKEGLQTWT